jgi:transposase
MDHHGIIAAVCRDLLISDRINKRIGSKDPRRVVQPGTAVMAMIINGLGFTNRRLYLSPQFFQSKAITQFFENPIKPEQLDDHALGKALDEISKYGASRLFGEIAIEIACEHELIGRAYHHDSTSFSMCGKYDKNEPENIIQVKHGHSKDHRPDLKQVLLSLTMTGEANMPIGMEPHNGNASDKVIFHESIKRQRDFQTQLKMSDHLWIADSALYTPTKLLQHGANFRWISRVPETIKECRLVLEKPDDDFVWIHAEKGYKYTEIESDYGGIKQRWVIVFSQQAFEREKKTFTRQLKKQSDELEKSLWHLKNQIFNCPEDAQTALTKIEKKYRYHSIKASIDLVEGYETKGRPNQAKIKITKGYRVSGTYAENPLVVQQVLLKKGRFILATNEMDKTRWSAGMILKEYKEQQCVESGFRFLKDPWFMADTFFLKTAGRIEALMMIMTLCLLVYNFAQFKLRSELKRRNETIPNQLEKQIQNPTLKWIFQIMEGIAVVEFVDQKTMQVNNYVITNLNFLRQKIIRLFGNLAMQIYGFSEKIAGT